MRQSSRLTTHSCIDSHHLGFRLDLGDLDTVSQTASEVDVAFLPPLLGAREW